MFDFLAVDSSYFMHEEILFFKILISIFEFLKCKQKDYLIECPYRRIIHFIKYFANFDHLMFF